MLNTIFLLLALCACQCLSAIYSTDENPRVTIPGVGTVIGETMQFNATEYPEKIANVDVYRGIPFAVPPLDNLRFAKPIPYGAWDGDYDGTYFRNPCIQSGSEENQENQSEDCLYLNVWVPKNKPVNATVMFWIHGGGFVFGSGASYGYNGIPLTAITNVIYVTTNYRLNSFGFLSLGNAILPGNIGLWDQQLALKWATDHIAAFGGNPNDITIFGESAGAASIGIHLLAPQSWGYFSRAIMQSGCALAPWAVEHDKEKARQDVYGVANRAGCEYTNDQELVACLRDLPAQNLSDATTFWLLSTTTNVIPFVPVIDGDFLPDDPWTLLQSYQFKQCDILVGSNLDDGSIISVRAYPGQIPRRNPKSDYEGFRDVLNRFTYTYRNDLIIDAMEQQYIDWTIADDENANYFDTYMELITDEAFVCPLDGTARAHIGAGNTVYMYHLTYLPFTSVWPDTPSWLGVAHAEDMQFVFGYHFIPEENHPMAPEELPMILQTMEYWSNFAKTGNPNLQNIGDEEEEENPTFWEPYAVPDLHFKHLHPEFQSDKALRADSCHFWNDHVRKMVTFTADLEETERQWRDEFSRWKYQDMPNWQEEFNDYKNTINTCKGSDCS